MPRKDNRNNPLELRIKAKSLPKSVTPKRYLQRLLKAIDNEQPLPPLWDVRLYWRNPRSKGLTRRWRDDDFLSAIQESRSGFVSIVRGMVVERLRFQTWKK